MGEMNSITHSHAGKHLSQAIEIADGIMGTKEKIVVIPDGVGCIPALKET